MQENKKKNETFPLENTVLGLLEFLLHTTFFIFNGSYYQQTEGVAMGGPPSSIVAEIYMQATEMTALTTTSHPPKVWERHVDENPNYMTFFNTSTAFTPRPSSPWKLKKIPNSHSWTHSSRGTETRLFLSESTGNLHTQSNSVRAYAYLILSSQTSARSSIVGNLASALTGQSAFLNNFENIVNRRVDIWVDIKRYQDALSYALSKVDYSVREDLFMLPSEMELRQVLSGRIIILVSDGNFSLAKNEKVNAGSA